MTAHNETYQSVNSQGEKTVYDYVHGNAEPMYWISSPQTLDPGDQTEENYVTEDSSYYTRYYVLEISWDSSLKNNKETDLVYLLAESVSS